MEYFGKITTMLERITDVLSRFDSYAQGFPDHDLLDALTLLLTYNHMTEHSTRLLEVTKLQRNCLIRLRARTTTTTMRSTRGYGYQCTTNIVFAISWLGSRPVPVNGCSVIQHSRSGYIYTTKTRKLRTRREKRRKRGDNRARMT
jgi:hypothetical protein